MGGNQMSQTFAEVVENVKQLSPAEKEELQELLRKYLIEERREEILQNYQASLGELRKGKIAFSSGVDDLKEQLSHD
jgi:phosphopantothenate synthetase